MIIIVKINITTAFFSTQLYSGPAHVVRGDWETATGSSKTVFTYTVQHSSLIITEEKKNKM